MKVNRRSQATRSAATRDALVAAARPLFTEHGFAGVGTETIVRAAGVTRGALYHQFTDKTELFAAVFEAVERDLTARLDEAVSTSGTSDMLEMMLIGTNAWLDASTDPEVQRIVLQEAPAVLGWERWREIGMRYGMGLVEGLLVGGMETGRIPRQPIGPLAHVLIGALDEGAMYVARADDPIAAREETQQVMSRLVTAIVDGP